MLRLDFFPRLSGGTSAVVWNDPTLSLASGGIAAVALSVGLMGVLGAAPALVVPGAAIMLALSIWLLFGRDGNLSFLCVLALPLIVFAWATACWGVLGYWINDTPSGGGSIGLLGYLFMGIIAIAVLFVLAMSTDSYSFFAFFFIVLPLMWFSGLGVLSDNLTESTKVFVFVVLRSTEIIAAVVLLVGLVDSIKKIPAGEYKFDVKAFASTSIGLLIGFAIVGAFGLFSGVGDEFQKGLILLLIFAVLGALLEIVSNVTKLDIDGIVIFIPLLIGGGCYFLANGINYAPLETYDAVTALITGDNPFALFINWTMQIVNPLCAFVAQAFYSIAQLVMQLIQMLFGLGGGTLPFTLQELSEGFDALNIATASSFVEMIIGLVMLYICIHIGSSIVKNLMPSEQEGKQKSFTE